MNKLRPNSVTSFTIPSYAVFNDGVYPDSYPPHPNRPPQKPYPQDADLPRRLRPYTAAELTWLNREVDLHNTQRKPIVIDFQDIADRIRRIPIVPA